jgi:uncharacterized heparinase superfamily protein
MLVPKSEHYVSDTKAGITLHIGYDYTIEWKRIDTPAKVLHWIHHLSAKNWFTEQRLREFIETWCKHYGKNIHNMEWE